MRRAKTAFKDETREPWMPTWSERGRWATWAGVGVGEPELYLSAAEAVEAGNHARIVKMSRMIWLTGWRGSGTWRHDIAD